jgi:hypothetical protein
MVGTLLLTSPFLDDKGKILKPKLQDLASLEGGAWTNDSEVVLMFSRFASRVAGHFVSH